MKGIELSWVPPASASVRLIYPQGHFPFVSDSGPAIVFDTIMKKRGISIAAYRVSRTYTPCLPIIGIHALHISLYFQAWIFTLREPRLCPSSESSGWLKTLSSAVLHLEKIDKGAEIGATLIESFFYCYCVENRFVMSTVVPDTAVLSLFFHPLSLSTLSSLSLGVSLIFRSPSQGPKGVKSIMKWVCRGPALLTPTSKTADHFFSVGLRWFFFLHTTQKHDTIKNWKASMCGELKVSYFLEKVFSSSPDIPQGMVIFWLQCTAGEWEWKKMSYFCNFPIFLSFSLFFYANIRSDIVTTILNE